MKRFINEMIYDFKWWAVRVTQPWREVFASLDLEWRIFAQRHNAAGREPGCSLSPRRMPELDPMEKVVLQDFYETEPDCLVQQMEKIKDKKDNVHIDTLGGV